MLLNKKGEQGPNPLAWLSPVIWLTIVVVAVIYGGVFFNSVKNSLKGGITLTNPYLWVIGILVLILLIIRRVRR